MWQGPSEDYELDVDGLFECLMEYEKTHTVKDKSTKWMRTRDFCFSQGVVRSLDEAVDLYCLWEHRLSEKPDVYVPSTDACQVTRERLIKQIPGFHIEHDSVSVLKYGQKMIIHASGYWVRRQWVSSGNSLRFFHKKSKATTFHFERIKEDEDEVVRYGDVVNMCYYSKSKRKQVWKVACLCPGKTGPVGSHDSLYIVGCRNPVFLLPGPETSKCCRGSNFSRTAFYPKYCNTVFTVVNDEPENSVPRSINLKETQYSLNVLVYNVWMMGWPVTFWAQPLHGTSLKKATRANTIPTSLRSVLSCLERSSMFPSSSCLPDVVVLCEAFDKSAYQTLKTEFKKTMGLVFETSLVGTAAFVKDFKFLNGGVTLLSRYPISRQETILFGTDARGDEVLANKGAIYCRIELGNGKRCHVIGTHLQAWTNEKAVNARKCQLERIHDKIRSLQIPESESVIIAGDMNICRVKEEKEYSEMLEILNARDANEDTEDFLAQAKVYLRNLVRNPEKKPDPEFVAGAKSYSESMVHEQQRIAIVKPRRISETISEEIVDDEEKPSINFESEKPKMRPSMTSYEAYCSDRNVGASCRLKQELSWLDSLSDDNPFDDPAQMISFSLNSLFTMNPTTNELATGGISADEDGLPSIYDFVLFSKEHKAPKFKFVKALFETKHFPGYRFRGKTYTDLSDHYPVFATLKFGEQVEATTQII